MQAIIFDLDDTLILERDYALSGFATVAKQFQAQLGNPDDAAARMTSSFDHGDRRRIFNDALAAVGSTETPKLIASMIECYRNHMPNLGLLADAVRCLERFQPVAKLGVITDGFEQSQANKVKACGLTDRVEQIIITAKLGEGFSKPHPKAFLQMAEALQADHQQCTYVADNPAKDFVAPNQLGWRSVRIVRPEGVYRNATEAAGGAPSHVIHSLDELESD